MRVALLFDDRDLTALSHLHRCRPREKGMTGVAFRGRPHKVPFVPDAGQPPPDPVGEVLASELTTRGHRQVELGLAD